MNAFYVLASTIAAAFIGVPALISQSPAEQYLSSRTVDPVANASAIIKSGHARFTLLTPQLIRMEWAEDGRFEDHPSLIFINRKLPVPEFRTTRKRRALTIDTDRL